MKFKKRTSVGTEIPQASMSDVAFLLLIFFMVSTIFSLEKGLTLPLPSANTAPKRINKANLCEISIGATGSISVDGQLTTLPQLEEYIARRQLENEKLVCVIETHPRTYYGVMVDVLDELKTAKARKITLRTARAG